VSLFAPDLSDADWSVIDAALCLYAAGERDRAQDAPFATDRLDAATQAGHASHLAEIIGRRPRP